MKEHILDIPWDREGTFISRPNRFLGIVELECEKGNETGEQEKKIGSLTEKKQVKVHIHDPGRLRELLYPGNRVLVKFAPGRKRKTEWSLVAARWDDDWILVNSGFHSKIAREILENDSLSPLGTIGDIRSEVKLGHSRIDFMAQQGDGKQIRELAIEVKGCTLTENGIALFPDAPTERGRRHLETLIEFSREGNAALLILVFRKESRYFAPNRITDPDFARVFYQAREKGVQIHPVVLSYDDEMIWFIGEIPILESDDGLRESDNIT